MLLVLGIVALVVVLVAVGSAMLIGARHARQEDGPESHPTDFVARAGEGSFAFRTTSESTGEFKARLEQEASHAGSPDLHDAKPPSTKG